MLQIWAIKEGRKERFEATTTEEAGVFMGVLVENGWIINDYRIVR